MVQLRQSWKLLISCSFCWSFLACYLDVETSVQHIWFCSSVVFLQIASFSSNCRCESCHGQAERLLDSAKEMEDSIAFNLRSVLVCIFVFWLLVWAVAKRYVTIYICLLRFHTILANPSSKQNKWREREIHRLSFSCFTIVQFEDVNVLLLQFKPYIYMCVCVCVCDLLASFIIFKYFLKRWGRNLLIRKTIFVFTGLLKRVNG